MSLPLFILYLTKYMNIFNKIFSFLKIKMNKVFDQSPNIFAADQNA
jgi:hypothetical protein